MSSGRLVHPSIRVSTWLRLILGKYVVSFNGATRLIQGHEFFTQAFCELSVMAIVPNLFFTHSRLNQDSRWPPYRFPLVLTSAITAAV